MELRKSHAAWSTIARILLVVVMVGAALNGRLASAAISHRAAIGGNNAGGATTLVLTKPSSPSAIVAGDVMVAVVTVRGGTGTTITPPSGWNLINSNDSGTSIKSSTYYKVATASEGASYTWSLSASLKASGVISAYSGVDTASPIMVQANQVNASSTTMTAPSVTSTADGAMVIAAYSSPRGVTYTQGSSMTLRGQSSSTGNPAASQTTSGLQDTVQATLGASGTKTMTQSTGDVSIGHTIALNPKPTFEQSGYRWFANEDYSGAAALFAKSWGGENTDTADAIAIDPSGNTYVAGSTKSANLTSGDYDQFLVKYDSFGVEQWSKTWGGTGVDYVYALTLDTSGNIYVAGDTNSSDRTAGIEDQTLVKYDSSGVEQWSKTWGGTGTDTAFALTVDTSGNIYVVGFTNSAGLTAGDYDQTLVKYNSSGVEQWSKTWGGTGADTATAIALDSSNNIYVAGDTGSSGLTAGLADQTLVMYNSSGVEQWSKTWGGTGSDYANDLVLDASGNIYVAGTTNSTGLTTGDYDQTLVKYNSSGVEQWSKTWGGTGADTAKALSLDTSGNIYVVGNANSTGLTAGDYDQTLVKYNSSGVEQWSKTWGGTGADTANDLVLDASGNIYVVGHANSTDLATGGYDQTFLKYDSSGTIPNCTWCVDRTTSEVDRTTSEVNRTITEVDRTITEVNRTVTEVDRTGFATITVVCPPTGVGVGVGSPLNSVAQNTATTALAEQQIFRLRTTLHVSVSSARSGHIFKLQYATMSGSCDTTFSGESYSDVTTSTPIAYANNSTAADGQGLIANANDPTHNSDIKVLQEYNESNNTNVINAIAVGQDGLWDFALKDNGAPANTSYCFRMVSSTGSLLDSYTVIPQITTPNLTVGQSNFQFFNVNGDGSLGSTVSSTVAEGAPFSLRQLLVANGNQLAVDSRTFKLQYSEKIAGVCQAFADFESSGATSPTEAPASFSNDSSVGTFPWHTDFLFVTNVSGEYRYQSHRLITSDYGFSVPNDAQITGIKLTTTSSLSNWNNSDTASVSAQPYVEGALAGSVRSVGSHSSTTPYVLDLGDSTSLWGLQSLTAAQVNASDFGVALYINALDDLGMGFVAPDFSFISIGLIIYYQLPATGDIIHEASLTPAHNSLLTTNQDDPAGGGLVVLQRLIRQPSFTVASTIGAGGEGLWDIRLQSTAGTAGRTFCFKVVNNDGSPLDSYGVTPEVTIAASQQGLDLEGSLRGGQGVVNGNKSPFSF